MASLRLSERWWGLDDKSERAEAHREAVRAELNKEVVTGHPLYGQLDRVEAFFEASDDVLVRIADGTFALVHPTWSQRAEAIPYPRTQLLGTAASASQAVGEWELLW